MERLEGSNVAVKTGIFGDLTGNLARATEHQEGVAAVVVEWPDLDARLGLRASGGWSRSIRLDIAKTVAARLMQLADLIEGLASGTPVALAGPSLPLPPLGHTPPDQATTFELLLQEHVLTFLRRMSERPGVRVVHPTWLENVSPLSQRLDPRLEILAGFPYSLKHADALAAALVNLLYPRVAKKGLIVDLDDTLWAGIVGEVGVESISWHQEHGTQIHALLQQMLGQLAESGVLLAIASKNEAAIVRQALQRPDLLLPADSFFPVIAGWGPKSAAVKEILQAWNVGAESVVILDDNPMELEEVRSLFPEVTGLRFTPGDPAAVWRLLGELRELFGKQEVHTEDVLRASSLRAGEAFRSAGGNLNNGTAGAEFLASLGGCVEIDYRLASADERYLELINKTNQFNLNGARMTQAEWNAALHADGAVAVTVSYRDKFGPLGRIAVLLGRRAPDHIRVTAWAMSCRAFSRKIEYHLLDSMFGEFDVECLLFDFRATSRNEPLQSFFRDLGVFTPAAEPLRLSRGDFRRRPPLPHEVRVWS